MKSTSKRLEFVRLKAEGKSNAQLARILHISESTASCFSHELEGEISQYKADQLQELYDAYHMTREARIRQLGAKAGNGQNSGQTGKQSRKEKKRSP